MGAFDGDKTLGRGTPLPDAFQIGDKFIVHSLVEVMQGVEIPGSELGPTTKTILSVAKLDSPDDAFELGLLGSVAEKMAKLEDDEVPAIVQVHSFTSKTYGNEGTTLRFIEKYDAKSASTKKAAKEQKETDKVPF